MPTNPRFTVAAIAAVIVCGACPAQDQEPRGGPVRDTVAGDSAARPSASDTSVVGVGAQKGMIDDTVARPAEATQRSPVNGRARAIPSEPRPDQR